jgi:hypothetical protein
MSLSTVLKTVGADLAKVGGWIEDGLKVAAPIIGTIDPPLGAIIAEVESVVTSIEGTAKLTESQLAAIVSAVATLESIKSTAPAVIGATT